MGINLEKATKEMEKSFTVCLEKKAKQTGIEHEIFGAVKFAPDISGSMSSLYSNKKVQEVLERLFVVALGLDDDGSMQVFPFSSKCEQLEKEVTIKNYEGFVDKEILKNRKNYYFGGTDYTPMLDEVYKDFKNNNKSGLFTKKKVTPSLVLCIVDGDTSRQSKVKETIIELSKEPIFFIFFGIGNDSFRFLKDLDTMSGRYIDNAAFYNVNSIDSLSDKDLYDMIAEQYVEWFYQMKQRNKI